MVPRTPVNNNKPMSNWPPALRTVSTATHNRSPLETDGEGHFYWDNSQVFYWPKSQLRYWLFQHPKEVAAKRKAEAVSNRNAVVAHIIPG